MPFVSGSFEGCPPIGDGGDPLLNILKNRDRAPELVFPVLIQQLIYDQTPALLQLDVSREKWSATALRAVAAREVFGVVLEAYVTNVQPTSRDSSNCHSDDRNLHVYLGISPQTLAQDTIAAIVTRRILAQHPLWRRVLPTLVGKKVRVTGWRIWNQTHVATVGRFSACPSELHPVTKIEFERDGHWIPLD
jgi:hypothetical protein